MLFASKFYHIYYRIPLLPSIYSVNLNRVFTVLFVDIDECKQDNTCKNGRCMNEPGSFKCVCERGFTPSSDGKACLGKSLLLLVSYILPSDSSSFVTTVIQRMGVKLIYDPRFTCQMS